MLDYPLDLVARVMGGKLSAGTEGRVRRVCTDSRQLESGDLFFALKGENHDGHKFVQEALKKGAVAAVVARGASGAGKGALIEVDDPLQALGEFGKWHRDRFELKVVAVTGSVGKTTTKDFVAGILGQQWNTLKSPASYNAEIGLPLTLLQLTTKHQAVVLEMAMRGPGQIRYLARIARPDVVAITNIGLSHMELLGSQEAIAEAKAEALDYLPNGGTAVLNGDDRFYGFLKSRVPPGAGSVSFGIDRPEREAVTGTYLGPSTRGGKTADEIGARFALRASRGTKVERVTLPLLGRHNVMNALAAAAVGQVVGISFPRICRGLENADTSAMRMAVHKLPDGGVVLDDAYNASSPDAVFAALEVLREMPGLRKIAVLGDMLELGPASDEAHRNVGRAAADLAPTLLITVGERAALIAEAAKAAGLSEDSVVTCAANEEAVSALAPHRKPGDVVLVKGSRGMAMESVVRGIAG